MHSSIIHDSQKVETTQMSIQWQRNKQNTVQQYNGLLFGHKKKVLIKAAILTNLENVMLSERNQTKDNIYYDSIYMKCPELANLCRQRMGGERNWERLLTDMGFLLRGGDGVLELDGGDG